MLGDQRHGVRRVRGQLLHVGQGVARVPCVCTLRNTRRESLHGEYRRVCHGRKQGASHSQNPSTARRRPTQGARCALSGTNSLAAASRASQPRWLGCRPDRHDDLLVVTTVIVADIVGTNIVIRMRCVESLDVTTCIFEMARSKDFSGAKGYNDVVLKNHVLVFCGRLIPMETELRGLLCVGNVGMKNQSADCRKGWQRQVCRSEEQAVLRLGDAVCAISRSLSRLPAAWMNNFLLL